MGQNRYGGLLMPKNKKVLYKLESFDEYVPYNRTLHSQERFERLKRYQFGTRLDAFVVDTYHKDGLEVHIVDSKGYIHIYNKDSLKFITALSGRPEQIKFYYTELNLEISDVVKNAILIAFQRNKEEGANEW